MKLENSIFFDNFLRNVKKQKSFTITGLTTFSRLLLTKYIKNLSNKKILFITSTEQNGLKYKSDLETLFDLKSEFLPYQNVSVYETISGNLYDYQRQLEILLNKPEIVIAPIKVFYEKFPEENFYKDNVLRLEIGESISQTELLKKLINLGYKRATMVSDIGEFSIRGDIADIYSLDENPIRIEFFDDEIESIRYFSPEDQKSISFANSISIKPNFEFIVNGEVPEEEFGKQKYLQKYTEVCSISDYLDDTITIFKDYEQLKVSYRGIMNEIIEYRNSKDTEFDLEYMMDFNKIHVDFPVYYFSLNNLTYGTYVSHVLNFGVRTINSFNEKYNFETPLTGNYPAFVIFKDGKIDSILQGTDNAPVTLSKVESYLELNNIKEGE